MSSCRNGAYRRKSAKTSPILVCICLQTNNMSLWHDLSGRQSDAVCVRGLGEHVIMIASVEIWFSWSMP